MQKMGQLIGLVDRVEIAGAGRMFLQFHDGSQPSSFNNASGSIILLQVERHDARFQFYFQSFDHKLNSQMTNVLLLGT